MNRKNYEKKHPNQTFNYILSGIGPDTNEVVRSDGDYKSDSVSEKDFHPDLWDWAVRTVKQRYQETEKWNPIGIDTQSLDSLGNILNTFPYGTEGNYIIVSRLLHNLRFKMIERLARKKGLLSKGLKLKYVATIRGLSLKNIVYDMFAIGKEILREI